MIYKSVSIKNVIGRVIRSTRLQDSSFIQDMNEWIPEAMGYMRTRVVLSPQWKDIEVEFHKGKLPCDLRTLQAVAYNCMRMRYNRGIGQYGLTKPVPDSSFISQPTTDIIPETITTKSFTGNTTGASTSETWQLETIINVGTEINVLFPLRKAYYTTDIAGLNVRLNGLGIGTFECTWDKIILGIKIVNGNGISGISLRGPSGVFDMVPGGFTSITTAYETNSLDSIVTLSQCMCLSECNYTYYTEMDYINTSLCDGTVRLFYKAIPIDEDGFPKVPDNEDYKEAIYWYVRMKMIGCGYIDTVFKYTDCEDRFWAHARRAIGQIRYPSPDQVETMQEISTRLILPENYFETFFANPGKEGMIDI